MAAKVVLDSLRKEFGKTIAVEGVSLTINPGEFVCLLGPSGSGKTTILRLIAGFEQPTSGEIYIGERPSRGIPSHRRNLGMVAQDFALFPHMTAAQNIGFGLRMRHIPPSDISHRIDEALTLVDLEGYGNRFPSQLSGGQQQRIALARALVTRPMVLLLDEPFGALDRKLRDQLQVDVRRLQQRVGITTIFVTHDQSEALAMADRIAVMHRGILEQVGTPLDVYERPATRFVADFIGLTNFFKVLVEEVRPDQTVVRGPGDVLLTAEPAGWSQPKMQVELAIRPERISIGHSEGANCLPGEITEITYLGDRTRINAKLKDDSHCFVVLPNAQVRGETVLKVGDVVDLTWLKDAGILLRV